MESIHLIKIKRYPFDHAPLLLSITGLVVGVAVGSSDSKSDRSFDSGSTSFANFMKSVVIGGSAGFVLGQLLQKITKWENIHVPFSE